MGQYTAHQDRPDIDQAVQSDIDAITAALLDAYPETRAIILAGGFGRGEGAVITHTETPQAVNDYDLVIVTTNHVERPKLSALRRQIADSLPVTRVDVIAHSPSALRRLPLTIYNHDLKHGSQVIYGDPDIRDEIPRMDSTQIPLVEAELELFTRLWSFLGPSPTDCPDQQALFLLTYQMSKAVLACVDADLVTHGQYHHSYRERLQRFLTLHPHRRQPAHFAKWATEFKLRPLTPTDCHPLTLWATVRSMYLTTWLRLAHRLYPNLQDWNTYARHYRTNRFNLIRRLGHLLVDRNLRYERKIRLDIAQLYLILAFDGDNHDAKWLAHAKTELRPLTSQDLKPLTWDQTRAIAARLRMDPL